MYYIGVDLGGTNIAAGVVSPKGEILSKAEAPTLVGRPYREIVRDMAACINQALARAELTIAQVHSIGVGIPGVADQQTGVVIFCTNMAWHDIPLREELRAYFDRPIFIDNDANVAAWAEYMAGSSRGTASSVFLTLGTGLGAGMVINGHIWSGAHGVATELGHLTMELDGEPCTCGKDGCWERYCSATALIRMAREACAQHADCQIMRACGGDLSRVNAKVVIDAAREGDDIAVRLFNRYTRYLAIVVNSIISFLDPQMIVLGGGVSRAGDFLLSAVCEKLPRYLMYKTLPYADIVLAQLGNDAGIIGAALLGAPPSSEA